MEITLFTVCASWLTNNEQFLLTGVSSLVNVLFSLSKMPMAEEIRSSWADEVEGVGKDLPSPTEVIQNGFKIITEYKYNEDEKKVFTCVFYFFLQL